MKRFLLFLFCMLSLLSNAQDVYNQLNWGISTGTSTPGANKLADNSYLLYRNTNAGIIDDKTTESNGGVDFWLSKFNEQNQNSWQKSLGGSLDEFDGIVKELPNGDLIVGITSKSPVSGNKTVDTKGGFDYWVIRLDANGNIIWQKVFGTINNERLKDILVVSDNQILVSGLAGSDGITGDKTEPGYGNIDIWMVMMDGSGNIIWDKTIGGTDVETSPRTTYNSTNQQIYVACESNSGIGGMKTIENYGGSDIWLLSINLTGDVINQQNLGGSLNENIVGINLDPQGNIFLTTTSLSDQTGNKTLASFGSYDTWLVKLDSDFNILVQNVYGGVNYDVSGRLIFNQNNDIVIVIEGNSGITGNRTEIQKGTSDCWFLGLSNQTLDIKWQKAIGGSLSDSPILFWETPSSYKVISNSNSPASIDKTVSTWGDYNFWVFELSKTVGVEELSNEVKICPNPSHDYLEVSSVNGEFSSFIITEINGSISKSSQLPNDAKIEISDLKPGVYFLHLKSQLGTESKLRFIKN